MVFKLKGDLFEFFKRKYKKLWRAQMQIFQKFGVKNRQQELQIS
jgi:hypothetical protein